MDPADYRLYRSQTAVMAAIRQAVTAGYRYYLVATTPEEKALVAGAGSLLTPSCTIQVCRGARSLPSEIRIR